MLFLGLIMRTNLLTIHATMMIWWFSAFLVKATWRLSNRCQMRNRCDEFGMRRAPTTFLKSYESWKKVETSGNRCLNRSPIIGLNCTLSQIIGCWKWFSTIPTSKIRKGWPSWWYQSLWSTTSLEVHTAELIATILEQGEWRRGLSDFVCGLQWVKMWKSRSNTVMCAGRTVNAPEKVWETKHEFGLAYHP